MAETTILNSNDNSQKPTFKEKLLKALKYIKNNIMVTSNGMAIGLFGTLIIGTIFDLFAKIPMMEAISSWTAPLKGILMGAGIGVGVALAKKRSGVAVIAILSAGAIGNYAFSFSTGEVALIKDPLSCYVSTLLALLVIKLVMRKKTPVDLILIPLLGVGSAMLYSFLLATPIHYITIGIGELIRLCFSNIVISFFMCILVSMLVGMALTAPISSVAICVAINIGGISPLASTAALIGCCTQMVGFAIQSKKDNSIWTCLAIGLGTSMLQFKNIVRKPLIWLPTIIVSALLGPSAMLFPINDIPAEFGSSLSVGAGMGTSGLVGPLNFLSSTSYSWVMALYIIGICILAPILLVFLVDLAFRKLNIIKDGDFSLATDL